jgi:hypothetical protein
VTIQCQAHEHCAEPAVVGWGHPPVWICQRGFEERLAEIRIIVQSCSHLADAQI